MEIRHTQKKRDDCIYVTILYIFILVTTHQRFRTEEYNMKQKEVEGKLQKPTKIKKTEKQGQKSNGNTKLPESKR